MIDKHPALIARCTGTADVAAAVKWARARDLPVAVRGGGHNVAGNAVNDGGLVIDLSRMKGIHIDPSRRTARAQAGVNWGDLDRETQVFALATPGGEVSMTGIAGYTLSGGMGLLQRKWGMACDNLLSAEVVLADGEVVNASVMEHPDLYWAIRGGGGNFGIVTSFTFKLHDVGPEVAFAATFYPIEEAAQVMRRWRSYVESAPDEVTSTCVTMTFPANPELPEAIHNRPVIIVGGVHAGADVEAGLAEMQPLRELGTALFDMSGPTPFVGVQMGFDALFPRDTLRAYWKSQYVDELTDEAIDTIAAAAGDRPAPLTLVNTFHMGGAIARVGEEETAFHQRTSPYMVSIDGMWLDEADDDANIEWVRATWNAVAEYGTGEVYLNFTGLADEEPQAGVDSAYGRNLARLAEIKAKYDPENFFRINNNVVPA